MLNNFSFNDAYRVIANVIDERIKSLTRSGAGIEVTWGTVAAISSPYTCSVYLLGETPASDGFRIENGIKPNVLDPVRVSIDKRGNRWIDAVLGDSTLAYPKLEIDVRAGQIRAGTGLVPPADIIAHEHTAFTGSLSVGGTLRVPVATDASLSSTGHAIQAGPDSGQNIAIDGNEVMARNNGGASDLALNAEGGEVAINGNAGSGGLRVMRGGLKIGTTANPSQDIEILFGSDVSLRRSTGDTLKLGDGDTFEADYVRITGTSDASLVSTLHGFQIGATTASNLIMDYNEIQARINGATGPLSLNLEGGGITVGPDTEIIQSGEAWISVTFTNSWVNYGGAFATVQYRRDAMGFVHLKGLMKSGTIDAAAFTLPVGYRPAASEICVGVCNPGDAISRIDITSAGIVKPITGSNIYISLSGITFRGA